MTARNGPERGLVRVGLMDRNAKWGGSHTHAQTNQARSTSVLAVDLVYLPLSELVTKERQFSSVGKKKRGMQAIGGEGGGFQRKSVYRKGIGSLQLTNSFAGNMRYVRRPGKLNVS